MRGELASAYTLVIPTYNRPDLLRRLLKYLELQAAPFQVLILDSSTAENKGRNAETVAAVRLRARRVEYDPALSPFTKFRLGFEAVETPFASLCADDDILLVPSLDQILEFLRDNADYSAAHGFYFNFDEPDSLNITALFYFSPSIADPEAAQRLAELFRRYEALTYAVYRTSVAIDVYRECEKVQSILARELLGGAITVIAGKTARLKTLYYGRNTAPSAGYENWHPLEWLATDPTGMFREYLAYRSVLARYLTSRPGKPMAEEVALRTCDLIHLRYLAPFLQPGFLDFAIGKSVESLPSKQVIADVWKFWNRAAAPGWRARLRNRLQTRVIARGTQRYRFAPAFLRSEEGHERRVTPEEFDTLLSCLNAYSAARAR